MNTNNAIIPFLIMHHVDLSDLDALSQVNKNWNSVVNTFITLAQENYTNFIPRIVRILSTYDDFAVVAVNFYEKFNNAFNTRAPKCLAVVTSQLNTGLKDISDVVFYPFFIKKAPSTQPIQKKVQPLAIEGTQLRTASAIATPKPGIDISIHFSQITTPWIQSCVQHLDHPEVKIFFTKYLSYVIVEAKDHFTTKFLISQIPSQHADLLVQAIKNYISISETGRDNRIVRILNAIPADRGNILVEGLNEWIGAGTSGAKGQDSEEQKLSLCVESYVFDKEFIPLMIRCIHVIKNLPNSNEFLLTVVHRLGTNVGEQGLLQFVENLLSKNVDESISFIKYLSQNDANNKIPFKSFIHQCKQKIFNYCIEQQHYDTVMSFMTQSQERPYPQLRTCGTKIIETFGNDALIILTQYKEDTKNQEVKSILNSLIVEQLCQSETGYVQAFDFIKNNFFTKSCLHEASLICFKNQFIAEKDKTIASLHSLQGFHYSISIYQDCCLYVAEQLADNEVNYQEVIAFIRNLDEGTKENIFYQIHPKLVTKQLYTECTSLIAECEHMPSVSKDAIRASMIVELLTTRTIEEVKKVLRAMQTPETQRSSACRIVDHLLQEAQKFKNPQLVIQALFFVDGFLIPDTNTLQAERIRCIKTYLVLQQFDPVKILINQYFRFNSQFFNPAVDLLVKAYLDHDQIHKAIDYARANWSIHPDVGQVFFDYIKNLWNRGDYSKAKQIQSQVPESVWQEKIKVFIETGKG